MYIWQGRPGFGNGEKKRREKLHKQQMKMDKYFQKQLKIQSPKVREEIKG